MIYRKFNFKRQFLFKLRLVTFVIITVSFLGFKLREQKQYRLQISALKNPYRSIP